jgi:methionyl-tRNA formyltransferase
VHRAALELGLPVRHPARLKRDEAEHAAFAALGLDVAVVAAYGLILPKAMLEAPRRGCLNIHASLLPLWRGAAPIQRAILAGDTQTGITIMQMDAGLDSGPMLMAESTPILAHDSTATLTGRLAAIGARLIVEALREAASGRLRAWGRASPPSSPSSRYRARSRHAIRRSVRRRRRPTGSSRSPLWVRSTCRRCRTSTRSIPTPTVRASR